MNVILSIVAGFATGLLSGFGIGGGTLLMLWLTLVGGMGQLEAAGINLTYFLCVSPPALWGHIKHGLVEKQAVLWCTLAGLPCCLGASLLSQIMETELLRRVFGIFLLVVGIRELFAKKQAVELEKKENPS